MQLLLSGIENRFYGKDLESPFVIRDILYEFNSHGSACTRFLSNRQIATRTWIWGIVLYLIYRVQLANELDTRKSFLRVLDKNKELMKAEEDKRALADDNRKLAADNERIREQVAVSGMNEMQVQIVQVRAPRSFPCVFLYSSVAHSS